MNIRVWREGCAGGGILPGSACGGGQDWEASGVEVCCEGGYMDFIRDVLKGAVIAIAGIVPGVSGGTMMVSMGIYDDVIHAVTGFFAHWKKSVRVLFPLAAGMALGLPGFSRVIEEMFRVWPWHTGMLFTGLIFGGVPVICKKLQGRRLSAVECMAAVTAFALVVWMQNLGEGTQRIFRGDLRTGVLLFFLGAVAAAAMVIPGVSGSMLLMSLGCYTPLLEQVSAVLPALVGGDAGKLVSCAQILLPFGAGVAAGVILMAGLVEVLIKRHARVTYSAIAGLMVSSPVAVFRGVQTLPGGAVSVLAGVLLFAAGVCAVTLTGKPEKGQ